MDRGSFSGMPYAAILRRKSRDVASELTALIDFRAACQPNWEASTFAKPKRCTRSTTSERVSFNLVLRCILPDRHWPFAQGHLGILTAQRTEQPNNTQLKHHTQCVKKEMAESKTKADAKQVYEDTPADQIHTVNVVCANCGLGSRTRFHNVCHVPPSKWRLPNARNQNLRMDRRFLNRRSHVHNCGLHTVKVVCSNWGPGYRTRLHNVCCVPPSNWGFQMQGAKISEWIGGSCTGGLVCTNAGPKIGQRDRPIW